MANVPKGRLNYQDAALSSNGKGTCGRFLCVPVGFRLDYIDAFGNVLR